MSELSPFPWELVKATEHHGPYVCNRYGGYVCDLYAMTNPNLPSTANGGTSRPVPFPDADANAAHIILAANNHHKLVKALYEISTFPYTGTQAEAQLRLLANEALASLMEAGQ